MNFVLSSFTVAYNISGTVSVGSSFVSVEPILLVSVSLNRSSMLLSSIFYDIFDRCYFGFCNIRNYTLCFIIYSCCNGFRTIKYSHIA